MKSLSYFRKLKIFILTLFFLTCILFLERWFRSMQTLETVIVTGYAKAPQGTSMYEMYKHAGIVLEVDLKEHKIINAEFTFVAELTKNYFQKLLIGYCLQDGIEQLIERIQSFYFAPSQQAIIVALQAAVQRYWDNVKQKNK